jgi:hypothetical protein
MIDKPGFIHFLNRYHFYQSSFAVNAYCYEVVKRTTLSTGKDQAVMPSCQYIFIG